MGKRLNLSCRRVLAPSAAALLLLVAAGTGHAQGAAPSASAVGPALALPATATTAALGLIAQPAPLAARFSVSVTAPVKAGAKPAAARHHEWTFVRNAERVALLKGNIDEVWFRDARGLLSFERVFHDEQRVADYSAGELSTLGVQADWTALSSFIDPRELASLKLVSRSGVGAEERIRLAGSAGGQSLSVDWLPALQLPAKVVRQGRDGSVTRIELAQHAATAPAAWPVPGARSAGYLHLDAADFGDMDYEKVVRQSEALDVRSGWRSAHAHD